ncbi:MAG: VWA domain-containing protein [Bacteroidetes bacterium]|nr:VWA domain-containing protein [Bacteroidota bacterium]
MTVRYVVPMPLGATATRLRWKEQGIWYVASFAAEPQDSTLPGSGTTIYYNLKTYLGDKPLFFNLPRKLKPDSVLTVELTYVELLPYKNGVVTYRYPNNYQLIQSEPLQTQTLLFSLSSQRTIDTIAVLTPAGGTATSTGTHALAAFERNNAPAETDYTVSYSLRSTELGLFSLSTKPSDSLGYFAFIVEPNPASTAIIRKNFAVIIDRSGSMWGAKMEQAKNAASYIVNNLNEGDWFTLVDFDEQITPFRSGLVPYLTSTRDSALTYISTLTARGMTDIDGAFNATIPYFHAASDTAANLIIFLTDGQATIGQRNTDSILARVARAVDATGKTIYIFTFGIGTDVNKQLLTMIASMNSGIAEFLMNEELESRITDFYNAVRNPVLISPSISFSSPTVFEPYPDPLPNLYKGQQLLVSGVYTSGPGGTVTFSGTSFGQPVSYQYDLHLADTLIEEYAFLPKVWAKLKIEFLLVRYYSAPPGSSLAEELKDEIVALSIRYGVLSPFTSFSGEPSTGVERSSQEAGVQPGSSYQLLGNYPNPFNAGTVITFRIAKPLSRPVTVKIYNAVGQLVRILTVAVQGEGEYRVEWNATGQDGLPVPSGAYFYIIDFGDALLGGRMLLLK